MIKLEFNGVTLHQLRNWLGKVPENWRKVRGRINYGVGLELKYLLKRKIEQQHLVITEWKFTWTRGRPKMLMVFLFDTNEDSCEVFVAAGDGQPLNDEKVANAIEMAFEDLNIHSRSYRIR